MSPTKEPTTERTVKMNAAQLRNLAYHMSAFETVSVVVNEKVSV